MSAPPLGWDAHVHVFDEAAPVVPGHYRPDHHPLAEIEALAAAHGVGHLVFVQPSVYGTDNALLLRALAREPGRHRGVVVVDADIDEATLDAMHAAGVRGVRFNLVSPVGERATPATPQARFAALAPKLRQRGWHVQWYVPREQLGTVLALHQGPGLGLPCVLDHLAGLRADTAPDDTAWPTLSALAGLGAWIKLSGWYRLGAAEPYTALQPLVERVVRLFGPRCVWGSDWPHTSFARAAMPTYASTWQPVVAALGETRAEALRSARPAIYD